MSQSVAKAPKKIALAGLSVQKTSKKKLAWPMLIPDCVFD
jgi:hypothetical protein